MEFDTTARHVSRASAYAKIASTRLAVNKSLLARRFIAVLKATSDARDPLTGWTRKDAEMILQETKQFQQTYETNMETLNQLKRQQSQMQMGQSMRTHPLFGKKTLLMKNN
ncbi:unnamed protein product [Adineta ricciae]|uniref:Uncharacterized protein n=1 Tax=Adineta ricciae TaxID=249248 RepID=A0A815FSR3_ADIRI|nr:unnamed protein product [Adineta ricciae]CAF1573809.1 unnamed protein product [Adineta ricciae]